MPSANCYPVGWDETGWDGMGGVGWDGFYALAKWSIICLTLQTLLTVARVVKIIYRYSYTIIIL